MRQIKSERALQPKTHVFSLWYLGASCYPYSADLNLTFSCYATSSNIKNMITVVNEAGQEGIRLKRSVTQITSLQSLRNLPFDR